MTQAAPVGAARRCGYLAIADNTGKVPFWNSELTDAAAPWLALDPSCHAPATPGTLNVEVSGRAMPWVPSLNPAYQYQMWGELMQQPTRVHLADSLLLPNGEGSVTIQYVSGCANFGWACVNANGQLAGTGPTEVPEMPGIYIPGTQYLQQLLGAFADADGVIVGAPFALGNGPITVPVAPGATHLQLGFNDGFFDDNSGAITVKLTGVLP